MIEQAPKTELSDELNAIVTLRQDKQLSAFVSKINEEYLYWDKVKYKKSPNGCTARELWSCVVADRRTKTVHLSEWAAHNMHFGLTNTMQRLCHELDVNFGGSWESNSVVSSKDSKHYLASSLMEEAIASSQMEGASTTRKVAKEMLRKGLAPKDKSQQMIHNNYQTICFIADHRNQPVSEEMILHIHRLMTEKTLDNPEDAGKFRTDNEVVVQDMTNGEVVHTPPSFEEIPNFISEFCAFFNQNHSETYIHPVIRGIILHYVLAYLHPFVDGNGRTARAIFYWYMLRQGYWLTEYLSISRIIYRRKPAYEKAFLYAEASQNDMGYFVLYNLNVLIQALNEFRLYLQRKTEQQQDAQELMRIGGINERQAEIIRLFRSNPKLLIVVKDVQTRFSVTPTTAKNDILGLMARGLLSEIPINGVKKGYIRGVEFDAILSNFL